MFACRDATELMTDARDGMLRGWVAAKFRFHMLVCPHCRACSRQVDAVLAATQDLQGEDVPAEIEERAVAAFRTRASRRPL